MSIDMATSPRSAATTAMSASSSPDRCSTALAALIASWNWPARCERADDCAADRPVFRHRFGDVQGGLPRAIDIASVREDPHIMDFAQPSGRAHVPQRCPDTLYPPRRPVPAELEREMLKHVKYAGSRAYDSAAATAAAAAPSAASRSPLFLSAIAIR